jgi:hypothetical protein
LLRHIHSHIFTPAKLAANEKIASACHELARPVTVHIFPNRATHRVPQTTNHQPLTTDY